MNCGYSVKGDSQSKKIALSVLLCAIWYHLYNFKNVKNIHGEVLILVLKVTLVLGCFSYFLNCTNGTKSRNALHIYDLTCYECFETYDTFCFKRCKYFMQKLH